jgi:hypothetical protein
MDSSRKIRQRAPLMTNAHVLTVSLFKLMLRSDPWLALRDWLKSFCGRIDHRQ